MAAQSAHRRTVAVMLIGLALQVASGALATLSVAGVGVGSHWLAATVAVIAALSQVAATLGYTQARASLALAEVVGIPPPTQGGGEAT